MVVTSIRFPENEYKKVKKMADFAGTNVTAFMRAAILEKIEDQEDYADCVAETKKMRGTVARSEVMREVFGTEDE
ncbi:ribbon-helix-helix protein, CopG family [Lactobacillus sp. XV13L]|nr:ribbon-helix-helix protein, CopG family [Lactobacillus sp. XV13L]